MQSFVADDGTRLAFHPTGESAPLVCLPGGPMLPSACLGDLGGLSAHRTLALLDLRGTGASAAPLDPASRRVDRQVADVDALRRHLRLERVDLLGHSAGASLAVLYAARHPERVGRLVLVSPSAFPVGLEIPDDERRQVAELRRGEPWFPESYAAFERIWSGAPSPADWDAIEPFTHGRWDAERRARVAWEAGQQSADAAQAYYAAGAMSPEATRSALAQLGAPVLLVAGAYDVALPPASAAAYAALFPHAELAVAPRAGHSAWLDDPEWFVATLARFLG